jgi:Ca-activated chloride channel family protein
MNPRMVRFALLAAALLFPALTRAQSDSNPSDKDVQFGLYLPGDKAPIPLPLQETKVRGTLRGFVAQVDVTQTYVNPYDAVIEAIYVFPLPERAAVHSMTMTVAGREIVAEIKAREQAEKVYEEAVASGHTASLMTQERPNIFTQKVGNIPAGHTIEVKLSYVEALPYEEGVSSFVFPTVVGPRYIPGNPVKRQDHQPGARYVDTDRVEDASRISPPALGENETSAHRIDLELLVQPGMPIRSLKSPSHKIVVDTVDDSTAKVALAPADRMPNKDFVLRIDVRGKQPKAAVLTHRKDGDGYFTLVLQPPARPREEDISPKDLFFVVDTSGSMSGQPVEAAKAMVRESLRHMNAQDRFTIMRFSDHVSALSAVPLSNTPDNVHKGLDFIDAMAGEGGTEMLSGILRALEGKPEPGRLRVVFFLTDGYIGNDAEILAAVTTRNEAGARLFSMGVGTSVNRHLLSNMARLGRGEVQFMRLDEPVEPFVEKFYRRVRNPVLTDITLKWQGVEVFDQSPGAISDLFDGQPVLVHGRFQKPGHGTLVVSGKIGAKDFRDQVAVDFSAKIERPEVASLWARSRIAEWTDEENVRPGSRKDDITAIALAHTLVSAYTAFVAVDREQVVRQPSEPLIPVQQRLPLPEGVSRLALAELSRHEIPPGDPIVDVAAPDDARRVTVFFPFGLVKELVFDAQRARWRGRFLVPEGVPDGDYTMLIVIELADGSIIEKRQPYVLDSKADEFDIELSKKTVKAGASLKVDVNSVEAADEVYVHCPELKWMRQVLASDDGVHWTLKLRVPAGTAAGEYRVMVVVRDKAGNRAEQWTTFKVEGR